MRPGVFPTEPEVFSPRRCPGRSGFDVTRLAAAIGVYASLLRVPEAARLLGGALLGRAQLGMASLAILLVVHDEKGSFADAGIGVAQRPIDFVELLRARM